MKINFPTPSGEILSYSEAIWRAVGQSMEENEKVIVYGLGVDDHTAMYGTTRDYKEIFGDSRCFDTPLSEDAMTGFGIGLALRGFRGIHVHQRADFLTLCMNQLINMAAKIDYVSNGTQKCPFVVRAIIGRSWGQGAQHSQSLYSLLSNIPGLTVLVPATPQDAFNCYYHSLKTDSPSIIFEHRMLYKTQSSIHITEELPSVSLINQGNDLTLCSLSHATYESQRAIQHVLEKGISCDHFSIVNTSDLKLERIKESVKRTRRLLIVENGWLNCSIGYTIVGLLAKCLSDIKFSIEILGYSTHPCPTAKVLEADFYADAQMIANSIYAMLDIDVKANIPPSSQLATFKGPF